MFRTQWPAGSPASHATMARVTLAMAILWSAPAASAADLLIEVGAGPYFGESTAALGLRGSVAIDLGIVEPAFAVHSAPGRDPGPPMHVRQQGGLVLHGFAALLRAHTPPPHQVGLGVGFGSGQLEAAQEAGADDLAYRGTPGPYTVGELAYRYSERSVTLGLAFTTHFFTHVDAIGDLVRTNRENVGSKTFFSLVASAGIRIPAF